METKQSVTLSFSLPIKMAQDLRDYADKAHEGSMSRTIRHLIKSALQAEATNKKKG
jgi:hypothetical protein